MTEPEEHTPDDPMRQFLRELHKPDKEDEPEPEKPPGYVAREGNISKPPPEDPKRKLLRKLNGN